MSSRRKRMFRRRPPVGSAPGTMAPPDQSSPTSVRVVTYGPEGVEDGLLHDEDQLADLANRGAVAWVDITGFGDLERVVRIGTRLGVHQLHLEDAVHVHQRPKVEADGEQLFLVLRTAPAGPVDPGATEIGTDQVALFLRQGVVLTIRENDSPLFSPVRTRLDVDGSRIRNQGADYLAYALADTAVDGFFPIIDDLTDRVHDLEVRVLDPAQHPAGAELHRNRQLVSSLRRVLWPFRETLYTLQRDRYQAVTEDTRRYLRDTLDHSVQLLEAVDHLRDTVAGLMDVHLSLASQRMNEVMKVLTVISTLFIPLSFLAGIYGMNFQHMPELSSRWGYPLLLLLMAVIAGGMLSWFWRRGWIGGRSPPS